MPNFDYRHSNDVILNCIQDTILALPDAVFFVPTEFLYTGRPRIGGQAIDTLQDALDVFLWDVAQILGDGLFEDDPIAYHEPADLGADFRS